MIKPSPRLNRVKRIFDPYQDRTGFIRLDRNEDPVGWEPETFEALLRTLTPHDLAAYSDSTLVVQKLARWLGVEPEEVMVTAGSDAAIKTVFETYVDEGDLVVTQNPGWRMYEVYCDMYRGKIAFASYDRQLKLDVGAIVEQVNRERVRIVLLANPNQPTGTLIADSQLEEIIACAMRRDTVVAIDEAYHLFTSHTALPLVSRYPNLIVTRTFSKAFGLAGLRLGYCAGNPERIRELMLLRPVTDSNSLALKCAEFALDRVEQFLSRAAEFIKGREFLFGELVDGGVQTYPSHANFLLVKCNSPGSANAVVHQARQRGYLLKGPLNFAPLENHVRITIGPPHLMRKFWTDCGETIIHHAGPATAS